MKLSSLKFCVLLSLLCHAAGFAAFKLLTPVAAPTSTPAPLAVPILVVSAEPVVVKISAALAPQPAQRPADRPGDKLFAAEHFMPLKEVAGAPQLKPLPGEKGYPALARGQTTAARSSPLAGTSTNNIIVGARISRVFAVANILPEYYKNPKPEYPEAARRAHQEGVVLLRVHVTAHGRPDRVAVLESSGFEALDAAAVNAVRGWEFTPAQLGEAFVESEIDFPIQFRLN